LLLAWLLLAQALETISNFSGNGFQPIPFRQRSLLMAPRPLPVFLLLLGLLIVRSSLAQEKPAEPKQPAAPKADLASLERRIAELETKLAQMTEELQSLRKELKALKAKSGGGDAVAEELKALQGAWILIAYEGEGKRRDRKTFAKELGKEPPPLHIEGGKLTFGEGEDRAEFLLRRGEKPKDFTYHLDPTKEPKEFDLTEPQGFFLSGATYTMKGIYRLKGDRLEVCVVVTSQEKRPKDFTTEENSWRRLLIYERVKAPAR
jgi:uncharacterized protein (TIGR03067 family)